MNPPAAKSESAIPGQPCPETAFINGRFVNCDEAVVSVFDRGFLYGDGLFETVLILNGRPFRWEEHLDRLSCGAEFLGIALPFSPALLRDWVHQLIQLNQFPDALLRLNLSRGTGARGSDAKAHQETD